MKDWLSPADLAALQLPGLPATKRAWQDFIDRENWLAQSDRVRERKGRGGGLEYHVDLLPAAALAALAARKIGAIALTNEQLQAAAIAPGAAQLTLPAIESRDARLALIAAADRFARDGSLTRNTADRAFCALYNLDKIEVDRWVRQSVKRLAPRSLKRWRAIRRDDNLSGLGVDRGASRRGTGALDTANDGAVRAFILALIAHQPHLSADHVRENVIAKFADFDAPPIRTFQRFIATLKASEKVLLTKVTNPDAFKSRYRLAGTNSHPVSRLNELWMIDASPADVLVKDGRYTIYACIDVWSRRLCVHVTKTPRAEAVALLMRRAILAWGMPERVKTDNGSDFVAHASKRLFASLGIEWEASAPFSPEQKGHIERAIGTLQRDLMPLLPGFVGHSVADRKVIEARKAFAQRLGVDDARAFCVDLTAGELQTLCDEWAAHRYFERPHAGLEGLSPLQKVASFPGRIRTIDDVRALDMLLAPVAGKDGLRTVTKNGLRIDGAFYLCPTILPGTMVLVRMDPQDMGRAFAYAPDGTTYLGEAISPALAGIDPAAAVAEAKRQQKELLEAGTAVLRADMRKIKPRDMVDAVVRRRAQDSGKVVAFPRPSTRHTTPALDAAVEALREIPSPLDPANPKALDRITLDDITHAMGVTMLPETKQQRFRRALALEAELAAGRSIATADALWLGGYQSGSEYLAQRAVFEDFGEEAIR